MCSLVARNGVGVPVGAGRGLLAATGLLGVSRRIVPGGPTPDVAQTMGCLGPHGCPTGVGPTDCYHIQTLPSEGSACNDSVLIA